MLILLIGPKGSGKSHIGRLLESAFDVHFFHVEPLWMDYYAVCEAEGHRPSISEGMEGIRPAIEKALHDHDRVCIETTGGSAEIVQDLLAMQRFAGLLLVRIRAPLAICLERIAVREQRNQIPMDRKDIERIHTMADSMELPFDITIENIALSDQEILAHFPESVCPSGWRRA